MAEGTNSLQAHAVQCLLLPCCLPYFLLHRQKGFRTLKLWRMHSSQDSQALPLPLPEQLLAELKL